MHTTISQIDETPSQKPRKELHAIRGFVLFDVDRHPVPSLRQAGHAYIAFWQSGTTLRGESKFL